MTSSKSQSDPYDEFVAAIKLVTGEEVLTKVVVNNDHQEETIILDNPLICQEVRSMGANVPLGYKFEPWIKMSEEDIFIVDLDKIITLSEIKDDLIIKTYNNIIDGGFKRQHPDLDRQMGYINSVDDARKIIERLYKSDSASKEPKKDL